MVNEIKHGSKMNVTRLLIKNPILKLPYRKWSVYKFVEGRTTHYDLAYGKIKSEQTKETKIFGINYWVTIPRHIYNTITRTCYHS